MCLEQTLCRITMLCMVSKLKERMSTKKDYVPERYQILHEDGDRVVPREEAPQMTIEFMMEVRAGLRDMGIRINDEVCMIPTDPFCCFT